MSIEKATTEIILKFPWRKIFFSKAFKQISAINFISNIERIIKSLYDSFNSCIWPFWIFTLYHCMSGKANYDVCNTDPQIKVG